DWIRPAEDQEAERQHTAGAAAVAAEHEKARLQFDVTIVEYLDFQRHEHSSLLLLSLRAASSKPIDPPRGLSHHLRPRACIEAFDRGLVGGDQCAVIS